MAVGNVGGRAHGLYGMLNASPYVIAVAQAKEC